MSCATTRAAMPGLAAGNQQALTERKDVDAGDSGILTRPRSL
jgi:hypothetical protein